VREARGLGFLLALELLANAGRVARPEGGSTKMRLEAKKTAALANAEGQLVAFHPDGKRWAAAMPGVVYLWNGEVQVQSFEASPIQGLAFADDGKRLLISPHRIDLEPQTLEALPDPLGKTLNALTQTYELVASSFSPDGAELAVVASFRPGRGLNAGSAVPPESEQILILDGKTRKLVRALWRGEDTRCQAIAMSARFVAAGDVDVWLWPRHDGKARRVLKGPESGVRELRFSHDEKLLGAVDADGMATLWDTATGKPRARWKITDDNAPRLAFHPRLPVLATGSADEAIKLWSIAGAQPVLVGEVTHQGGFVEGLAFSPSGDRLLAAVGSHPIVYEVTTGP
jgi:WD40 repeat protein